MENMNMHCLDAEAILKERCPNFYNSLVEEYPEGFPLTDETFDRDNLSGKKEYWEKKLKELCEETSSSYLVLFYARSNAFVFFVGMKLYPQHPDIAAELGNYDALRKTFTQETAEKMARFYPYASDILLAKLRIEKLCATQPTAKEFLEQVEKTLSAIDRAIEYDSDESEAWVAHDPSLEFNAYEIIEDLLERQLIHENQLEGRTSGVFWDRRASRDGQKAEVTTLTSVL
ncbi:MAG: hypothetical protein SFW07_04260 [Gammaproteobacteria bacterium]|nr:hypothetical protein [Gammaproteobacteria bacterium]